MGWVRRDGLRGCKITKSWDVVQMSILFPVVIIAHTALFKTGSLDSAIQELSLAPLSWLIGYTLPYKYA